VRIAKIKSVKKIGIKPTMDIEVASREHIFYGNGIATSNSHAVSYALMAYWSAYLKANKKLEFYLHWLSNAKEKIDPNQEIYELVESAKIDHINVKTPLHEHPESNFSIQGKDIFFGIFTQCK
jgi:DNA polymerase III alpha subunit